MRNFQIADIIIFFVLVIVGLVCSLLLNVAVGWAIFGGLIAIWYGLATDRTRFHESALAKTPIQCLPINLSSVVTSPTIQNPVTQVSPETKKAEPKPRKVRTKTIAERRLPPKSVLHKTAKAEPAKYTKEQMEWLVAFDKECMDRYGYDSTMTPAESMKHYHKGLTPQEAAWEETSTMTEERANPTTEENS